MTMLAEATGPRSVGAATGASTMFAALAIPHTPAGLVADLTGSYRGIWGVLAFLLAISLIPMLLLPPHQAI
jgi:hypothetical protein